MNSEKLCGIYLITCKKACGGFREYVGQSVDIRARWGRHTTDLARGCGINSVMQACWDKYGSESFHFEVLELCTPAELNDLELFWIKTLKTWTKSGGMNMQSKPHSDYCIRNIPLVSKGKKFNHEVVEGTITQLSKMKGLNSATVRTRLWSGWALEKALNTPVKSRISHSSEIYTVKGISGTLKQLCEKLNLSESTVSDKLRAGLSPEKAFAESRRRANKVYYLSSGDSGTLKELCLKYDIKYNTVIYRLDLGHSLEDALLIPVQR